MKQILQVTLITCLLLCLSAGGMAQKKKKQAVDATAIPSLKIMGATEIKTCAGQSQTFDLVGSFANLDEPEETVWTIDGKQVAKGSHYTLDTSRLLAGNYKLMAELVEGKCVAYDNRIIVVNSCAPIVPPAPTRSCFTDKVQLTVSQSEVSAGELVTFTRGQITGGQNFGEVRVAWFTNAGEMKITSDQQMVLDTTGVPPDTVIKVRTEVAAIEFITCLAEGNATVQVKSLPVAPEPRTIATCDSFKRGNARVDNACKNLLIDVARQLQASPSAKLMIIGEQMSDEKGNLGQIRATNVKAALTQGAVGINIDANRIEVRGKAGSGRQARIVLIP